jgi:hypothetical protein
MSPFDKIIAHFDLPQSAMLTSLGYSTSGTKNENIKSYLHALHISPSSTHSGTRICSAAGGHLSTLRYFVIKERRACQFFIYYNPISITMPERSKYPAGFVHSAVPTTWNNIPAPGMYMLDLPSAFDTQLDEYIRQAGYVES